MLIDASNSAERIESLATANILQDLMESHGKYVWMLRSISETARSASAALEDIQVEVEVPQQAPVQTESVEEPIEEVIPE
jgi:hypothetical protein